jgi:hypothetical protein
MICLFFYVHIPREMAQYFRLRSVSFKESGTQAPPSTLQSDLSQVKTELK